MPTRSFTLHTLVAGLTITVVGATGCAGSGPQTSDTAVNTATDPTTTSSTSATSIPASLPAESTAPLPPSIPASLPPSIPAESTAPNPEVSSTTTEASPTTSPATDAIHAGMRAALDNNLIENPEATGHIVMVRSPSGDWSHGVGAADPKNGVAIDPTMSFRSASVTKTFVAASIYRLIELGDFTADTTIDELLSTDLNELLIAGGYEPADITVHHLLTHTSGALDFTFGPTNYVGTVFAEPQRRWTRYEQVALAMDHDPVGPPGAQYHYSDTGYALLGAIVEERTGMTMGEALRSLLRYEQLGLDHTYLESIEPEPPNQPPRVHQFFGAVDTYNFDPSLDLYGGGGLVSTLADLVTFFEALTRGLVFDDPATLEAMLAVPETNAAVAVGSDPRPYAAASGIFATTVGDQRCWGHQGFWGIEVITCPDAQLSMASSVSQAGHPESVGVPAPYFVELVTLATADGN